MSPICRSCHRSCHSFPVAFRQHFHYWTYYSGSAIHFSIHSFNEKCIAENTMASMTRFPHFHNLYILEVRGIHNKTSGWINEQDYLDQGKCHENTKTGRWDGGITGWEAPPEYVAGKACEQGTRSWGDSGEKKAVMQHYGGGLRERKQPHTKTQGWISLLYWRKEKKIS